MFLALNIAIFSLGFVAAHATTNRPSYHQLDIVKLFSLLQHFLNKLRNGWTVEINEITPAILPGPRKESIDEENFRLLTKNDVERNYEMGTWQRLAYEDFKTTILARGAGHKTFPCIYATMGYRSDDHRYVFCESNDPSEPRNIRIVAAALKKYLNIAKSLGPNTSLVIMGAPATTEKTVLEYNNSFWQMLRGLRIRDPEPWPSDVPQNTNSEKWTFCFDGQPLFPVSLSPAHQRRWSRHASVPIIALQPKWVLDKLLSTPEKRASATGKVRKLIAEYDQIDVSPDLTSYGQPGTSEVHQLCLLDENTTALCPYQDFDR